MIFSRKSYDVILRFTDSFRIRYRRISSILSGDSSQTDSRRVRNAQNDIVQSFLAGSVSALAFAPFDLFIPMVISVSWFYVLLNRSLQFSSKKVFLIGLFYGIGYFLAGIYWVSISLLTDIGKFWWLLPFSITLFPLILGLFFAFFAVSIKFIFKKHHFENYQKILIFAGIWLLFELLRGHILTGFPWNLTGYAMMFSHYSMQSASIFGVYGLSFFAILFCLIPILYFSGKKPDRIFAYFLISLFIGNLIFGFIRLESQGDPKYMDKKIRLVQGNIKQDMKWNYYEKYKNFTKHLEISKSKDHQDVDGFIWSETSIPYPIGFNEQVDSEIRKLVTKNDQFLISGALKINLDRNSGKISQVFNSIYLFSKDKVTSYDKHHLVPFGEYIPLQKYLPFVQKITNGSEGFSSGKGPKTLNISDIKISPLVCYEVIFPYNVIDGKNRPDLFVNSTNDAWFGVSSGPYQHLNISRMRSVEYGISMARVANSGISAYIDPFGRIIDEIPLNDTGYVDIEVIKPINATILSYFKYFMLLFTALIILVLERLFTLMLITPRKK